jgi:uncharacterized protein YndB with AHSA1/START domain
MTVSKAQTRFSYPVGEPVIRTIHDVDAPRERVWQAYVRPDLVERWWGPRRFVIEVKAMDVRPGGRWRFVHRAADGQTFEFFGEYRELVEPERLVQTFGYGDFTPSVETMTFRDLGDGRTRLEGEARFASFADRDAMVASGMESGARETYERLGELMNAAA